MPCTAVLQQVPVCQIDPGEIGLVFYRAGCRCCEKQPFVDGNQIRRCIDGRNT